MNALAKTDRKLPPLPEAAVLPTISRVLSDAIWLVSAQRAPPEEARSEARMLLHQAAPMFGGAKEAQVANWLKRVNLGTSQPIPPADFAIRASVIVDALQALPAGVFTVDSSRNAVLNFKWFPGAAEIVEFLSPSVRRIRDFERNLRSVALFVDPPPPPPPPTEAERKTIAELVRKATDRSGNYSAQEPVRTVEEQIAAIGEKHG